MMIVRIRTLALWMAAACALATYRLHSIETWPLGTPGRSQEHHSPAQLELERYGLQPGLKLPPRRVPPPPSSQQQDASSRRGHEGSGPPTTAPPWQSPPPPTSISVAAQSDAFAQQDMASQSPLPTEPTRPTPLTPPPVVDRDPNSTERPEWRAARLRAEQELRDVRAWTAAHSKPAVQPPPIPSLPPRREFHDRAVVMQRRRSRQASGLRRTPKAHRQPPDAIGPQLPTAAAAASLSAHATAQERRAATAAATASAAASAAAGAFIWGDFGLRRGIPQSHNSDGSSSGSSSGSTFFVGPPGASTVGMASPPGGERPPEGVKRTRKHALILFPMPGDATLSLTTAVAQSVRGVGKWSDDVYAAVSSSVASLVHVPPVRPCGAKQLSEALLGPEPDALRAVRLLVDVQRFCPLKVREAILNKALELVSPAQLESTVPRPNAAVNTATASWLLLPLKLGCLMAPDLRPYERIVFFDADSFVTADLASAALRPSLFGQSNKRAASLAGIASTNATSPMTTSGTTSTASSRASVSAEVARVLLGAQLLGSSSSSSGDTATMLHFPSPHLLDQYAAAFLVPPECPQAVAHDARLAALKRAGVMKMLQEQMSQEEGASTHESSQPLISDVVLPEMLGPQVGRSRDSASAAEVVEEEEGALHGRSRIEGRNAGAAAAAALASAMSDSESLEKIEIELDEREKEEDENKKTCRLYHDIDMSGLGLLDQQSLRAAFPDQSVQLSSKFVVLRPARLPSLTQLADSITRVAGRFLPRMSSDRAFLQLTLRNASLGFLTLDRLRGYAVEPTAAHRPSPRACPAFQRLYAQATGAPLDACTKRPARLQCAPKSTANTVSGADAAFGALSSSLTSSSFSSSSSPKHKDAFDPFGHLGRGGVDELSGTENHVRSSSSGRSGGSSDGGDLKSALAMAARKRAAVLFHPSSFLYPQQPMPPLPHELARDSRLLVDYQLILDKHRDSFSESRSSSNDDDTEDPGSLNESEDDDDDDDTADLKDALRDEDDCCWELDDDAFPSSSDSSGGSGGGSGSNSDGRGGEHQQGSIGSGSSSPNGGTSSSVGKSNSGGTSRNSKSKGVVVGIMAKKGEGSVPFEGNQRDDDNDDDNDDDDDDESNDQAAAVEESAARSALEAMAKSSSSSSSGITTGRNSNGGSLKKAAGNSFAQEVLHDLVLQKREFTAPIMPVPPSGSSSEEDPLAAVFGTSISSSGSASVLNGEGERSEGNWVNYDHKRASRYAQAAVTTNRDVAEKRKSAGSDGGSSVEFSNEQRRLFRQQRLKKKVRKRKAKKEAKDVSAPPAFMVRGNSGEDDAHLGSLGNSHNRDGSHSTRERLLKVGLHLPGKSAGVFDGKTLHDGNRREGEDALAAWKKYKGT